MRPDTGEYVWHYQTTPAETWDYTATQPIMLADLAIEGSSRKVLMQAPKNGFFYVLDRATGELISAMNFVPVTWASHIDLATGRPVENPDMRYEKQPSVVMPSPYGAHNWHPMSYSPDTGLVYIPAHEVPFVYANRAADASPNTAWNTGTDALIAGTLPSEGAQRAALRAMLKGRLIAWDPVRQREAWRVEYAYMWNGGTLATAGNLVFQGTIDGRFVAYDATDGKTLWSFDAGQGIVAGPVSYEVDGVQYIAVMAGKGGVAALAAGFALPASRPGQMGRVLAFKIGGTAQLPARPAVAAPPPPDLSAVKTTGNAKTGARLYADHCMVCHGAGGVAGGVLSDLRYSGSLAREKLWRAIVLDGALTDSGMVAFRGRLDEPAGGARARLADRRVATAGGSRSRPLRAAAGGAPARGAVLQATLRWRVPASRSVAGRASPAGPASAHYREQPAAGEPFPTVHPRHEPR